MSAEGATFSYDVNPDAPSATVTVSFEGVKIGSVSLDSNDASASVGGTVAGTTVKATITANWSEDTLTYSLKLDTPVTKAKTYSGTIVHWT